MFDLLPFAIATCHTRCLEMILGQQIISVMKERETSDRGSYKNTIQVFVS